MTAVVVVGEGKTEQTFVRDVLAPALAPRQIFLETQLIGTSKISRGGALTPQRVLNHLRNVLRQRRNAYVTTFFDLYRLDADFPGRRDAARMTDPIARAQAIEGGLAQIVVAAAECLPHRFVPHIQPYEFEALLFSDLSRLPEIQPEWAQYVPILSAGCRGAETPEHINDGQDTHPSARLENRLRPRYRKPLHGAALAARIGLDHIRARCVHFSGWLSRIEALQPLA
jgi:hypothetical protein